MRNGRGCVSLRYDLMRGDAQVGSFGDFERKETRLGQAVPQTLALGAVGSCQQL